MRRLALCVLLAGAAGCKPQDQTSPVVLDSKNEPVGTLIGQGLIVRKVGDTDVSLYISQNGFWINAPLRFFYESRDCTGPAYVTAGIPAPGFILNAEAATLGTTGQSVFEGQIVYADPATIREIIVGSFRAFPVAVNPISGGSCSPAPVRLYATVGAPLAVNVRVAPPLRLAGATK